MSSPDAKKKNKTTTHKKQLCTVRSGKATLLLPVLLGVRWQPGEDAGAPFRPAHSGRRMGVASYQFIKYFKNHLRNRLFCHLQ